MTNAMPGTFTKPAWPPSVPTGWIDPGGTTPVLHALRVQQAVHKGYSDWRAAHSRDIQPNVLKDNAGAYMVQDGPALAMPDALAESQAAADEAAQKLSDLVGAVRPDDDVSTQLAAQAYWNRKVRLLDSVKEPAKLMDSVRSLIASASPSELAVLNTELEDYLLSRGIQSTDWLQGALAERVPGFSDALAAKTLAARQHAVIAANHKGLINAIQKDVPPPNLLNPFADAINSTPYTGG